MREHIYNEGMNQSLNPLHQQQLGARASMKAIIYGLLPWGMALPPLGALLGFIQIRKAKRFGNPAVVGKYIFFLNLLATVLMVFLIFYLIDYAHSVGEQMQQMQQQQSGK